MIHRETALVLAALGLCAFGPAAGAQAPAKVGNRVIAGVVVSAASGGPLEGAEVNLQDTHGGIQSAAATVTDAAGRFSFQNLPDGKFILSASHRGYATAAFEEHDGPLTAIVTGENLNATGFTLSLSPLGAIFGTVTEDSGDPVPQAHLSLYRNAHSGGTDRAVPAGQAVTDEMGNFEIAHLAPADYFLCVSGRPWYRPSLNVRDPALRSFPRSPLDLAYPISCYPDSSEPTGAEPIVVKAGDRIQTSLTLHPVPATHIMFQALRTDPKTAVTMPQLRRSVFGFSDPVETEESTGPVRNDGTQNSVTIEIAGIPPGQYTLELPNFEHQGADQSRDSAKFGNVQLSSSDLSIDASSLQTMASIKGKLIVAGEDISSTGFLIFLVSKDGQSVGPWKVAANGEFKIPSLPPGNYKVLVRSGTIVMPASRLKVNGVPVKGSRVQVSNDPVVLTVIATSHAASVTGVVTRNGKPASGVFALMVPTSSSVSTDDLDPNQSDSDGSVTFDNVVPGDYIVVAIDRGWTIPWRRPEVIAPYLADGVRVSVDPGSKIVDLKTPLEAQAILARKQ